MLITPSTNSGRTHASGISGRSHRKETKSTQSAGVFDDLLSLPHDEKCDAEIEKINNNVSEVLLHPAGQKSLQGLVAQQQREQQGEREGGIPFEETGSEASAETSTMSYMAGDCGSPTQNASLSAAVAAAEIIDAPKAHSLSLSNEDLTQALNIIANELYRRTGGVPICGGAMPTPPSQAKSPKSSGSVTSLYGAIGSHFKSTSRQFLQASGTASIANRSKASGSMNPVLRGIVRRNSKDKNFDPMRRSLPGPLDEELPFPFHDEDDDHHVSTLRQGSIPPTSKMFASGRDFVMGTSPTAKPLPMFGDFGKSLTRIQVQRPLQIKSVKPKIDEEIKKYYGDGKDPPMFSTLTETLTFINRTQQRNTSTLNVSPRTAFDDRSLGSQSTASTSSGRAKTCTKSRAEEPTESRTHASSALSRSLRASSMSSMGSMGSINSADKTDPVDSTTRLNISSTDFISIAVVNAYQEAATGTAVNGEKDNVVFQQSEQDQTQDHHPEPRAHSQEPDQNQVQTQCEMGSLFD